MIAPLLLAGVIAALPAPVRGDFDHDGRPDVAELRSNAGGGGQLVVRRGTGGVAIVEGFEANEIRGIYLTNAKPRVVKTWCGKRGGPCARPEVRLTGDTLAFGTEEASASVALWNGKAFEIVPISD